MDKKQTEGGALKNKSIETLFAKLKSATIFFNTSNVKIWSGSLVEGGGGVLCRIVAKCVWACLQKRTQNYWGD